MTPNCDNCGEYVTERYVRVFAPTGHETVRVCPYCPDRIRDGSFGSNGTKIREARSPRRTSGNTGGHGTADEDRSAER